MRIADVVTAPFRLVGRTLTGTGARVTGRGSKRNRQRRGGRRSRRRR